MHPNDVSAARRSVLALFFLHGIVFSTWASRIPAIQQRLSLSPLALGLALLGLAMGSVPAMPLSALLMSRFGSRPVATWSTYVYCAALCGMALANNGIALTASLVFYGASAGVMDVAMNSHGVVVEGLARRPLMSGFHALFSLGGMSGAALGGLIARHGVPVWPHFAGASALFLCAAALSVRGLLPAGVDRVRHGSGLARPTRPLLALGLLAFCFLLSEGAVADWAAIYLHDALHTDQGVAALGYAVFSAAMTAGRFAGDRLTVRFGAVRLLRGGSALAAAGMAGALLASTPSVALSGFVAVGAGYSVVVPLIFSAAGRAGGSSAAKGLAAVNTTGYLGFLAGPPLIGFLAGAFTLRAALWLLVALSVTGSILAGSVAQNSASPPSTNSSAPTM